MRLAAGLLLLTLALAPPVQAEQDKTGPIEMDGIWTGEETDLLVRRTGPTSWMGSPTELPGPKQGRTWHFESLSGDRMRFWILLEGKATTQKLDVQEISLDRKKERFTVSVSRRKKPPLEVTLRRVYAPVPEKIGEVEISFDGRKGSRIATRQDVNVKLAGAFARAIATARKIDPAFKRVNIGATIERNKNLSKLHSRFIRRALGIDRVNGAESDNWKADIAKKLKAIKAGERPVVDERRDYAHHATALVVSLLLEKDLEFVICPAILSEETVPYLEWWIGKHAGKLPTNYRSEVAGWRTRKFGPMLRKTKEMRAKMKGWLFVSVWGGAKKPACRRETLEKKFDRK